jgi:protoheme IX farnesyltransferase
MDNQMKSLIYDYVELCKPKVVMLMIVTSIVGMCLAPAVSFPLVPLILGNLGIALVASAAAALNHVADQHIDKLMKRTEHRPVAQGRITAKQSIYFASVLAVIGLLILVVFINPLTAILTFCSLIGYAGCYTLYLKHATPQNIVIGGLAGAVPPLLGWTAVTNSMSPDGLLLVLIIYVWTPPHFWALAIARFKDYAKANVPMLPNTHGVAYTKLNILLYTILLACVSSLPYVTFMSGLIYFIGVSIANGIFIYHAWRLYVSKDQAHAMRTFYYSIQYLGIIFLLLLIDHFIRP